ncbi:hypothetical protein HMPREF0077_0942 [Anaerococcus tetradius ATCC 35098]|uniref:Uncharacterized protein n=1 Tax=Anaerococcus tetradius ATCC 35098 TaxID=525255 RepID=C2CHI2_9FIRM|nr:hypothetical protein HMPREF0077_0942 [Anaerococcus tetradius ATCC 35098]
MATKRAGGVIPALLICLYYDFLSIIQKEYLLVKVILVLIVWVLLSKLIFCPWQHLLSTRGKFIIPY